MVANTAVLWQMMDRIKDWFIHLLILSTAYEHDKQKTDHFKMEESKQNTVIADLNVALKKSSVVTYLSFCLFYSSICQLNNYQTLWFCNGICNFGNIFLIKNYYF